MSSEVRAAWVSGQLVPWREASIDVSPDWLQQRRAVTEEIRCYATPQGPAVFRLDDHIDRFFDRAGLFGLTIPFSRRELRAAVCQIVSANGFAVCDVHPIVFPRTPIDVTNRRPHTVETAVVAWPSRGANGNGRHADDELFIVRRGLVTASLDPQPSPVVRDTVLTIARDLGYATATKTIAVEDLQNADEAFFVATVNGVTSIHELDGTQSGEVTQRMQSVFADAVGGRDGRYRHWLHFVDECTLTGAYNAAGAWI